MRSEVEALTIRIERLEHANRRLKVLGVGVVLASIALVSMGLGGRPRVIEAEKLIVRDSHGRPRITIGTPEFAGAAVGMRRDEPAIWLTDESGSDRAILAPDGFYLVNGLEKPLVSLSSGPKRPELRFYAPDGKASWSAP